MQLNVNLAGYAPDIQQLMQLGYQEHNKGRYAEAASMAQHILKQNGKVLPAYYLLSDALASLKQYDSAAVVLINGLARFPNDTVLKAKYVWQLGHIQGLKYHKDVLHYLLPCIDEPGLDLKSGVMAGNLLNKKYEQINFSASKPEEVFDFIRQEFTLNHLNAYLTKTINYNLHIESLLKQIRAKLLLNFRTIADDDQAIKTFLFSLAVQCFNNEFVLSVSDSETDMLNKLINDTGKNPSWIKIALISCYKSLTNYPNLIESTEGLPQEDSLEFNCFFEKCWEDVKQERDIAETIQSYGIDASNDISVIVSKQYETYPYPRWIHPSRSGSQYIDRVIKFSATTKTKHLTDSTAESLLVAGCGTGCQPVSLAIDNPDLNITAFDLSKSSLSYGIRKSSQFNINNINWFQCDILNLSMHNEKYDIVECAGVLHHMESPEKGLQSILAALKPGGLMYLALYSEAGRKEAKVNRSMELIAENSGSRTSDIIEFRRKVIEKEGVFSDLQPLTHFADFYSVSALKDFVFHEHELQYDLPRIRDLCDKYNLKLVGFNFGENAKDRVQRIDPILVKSFKADNWDYWINLEAKHPTMFTEMYQFWLTYEPNAD